MTPDRFKEWLEALDESRAPSLVDRVNRAHQQEWEKWHLKDRRAERWEPFATTPSEVVPISGANARDTFDEVRRGRAARAVLIELGLPAD